MGLLISKCTLGCWIWSDSPYDRMWLLADTSLNGTREVCVDLHSRGQIKLPETEEGWGLAVQVKERQLNPAIFADWLDDHRELWTVRGDAEKVLEVLRMGW